MLSRRRGEESHTRWWFLDDLDKCHVTRADKGLWEFEEGGNYFQGLVEEGAFEPEVEEKGIEVRSEKGIPGGGLIMAKAWSIKNLGVWGEL